jgi:hypothetical protein
MLEVGDTFALWTVIEYAGRNAYSQHMWKCRCQCGTERSVRQSVLSKGGSKSCGKCRKNQTNRPRKYATDLDAALAYEWKKTQRSASYRGKEFLLTYDQWQKLALNACYFCGGWSHRRANASRDFVPMNGVDRLDSSLGYEERNCVSCCKRCNIAKSDMSMEKYGKWFLRVIEHQISLGTTFSDEIRRVVSC